MNRRNFFRAITGAPLGVLASPAPAAEPVIFNAEIGGCWMGLKPRHDMTGEVLSIRRGARGPIVTFDVGDRELHIAVSERSAALFTEIEDYLEDVAELHARRE